MMELLGELDPSLPFPVQALRVGRAKRGQMQTVKLPHGYLADRDDDTPPKGPRGAAELEAWEKALTGGG
jgi:hypothetical protein